MFFTIFYLLIFRKRGKEGERKEEKYQSVVASHVPPHWGLSNRPTTQARALTGNQTGNVLVCRPVLNPLSHTSQGRTCKFKTNILNIFVVNYSLIPFQVIVFSDYLVIEPTL